MGKLLRSTSLDSSEIVLESILPTTVFDSKHAPYQNLRKRFDSEASSTSLRLDSSNHSRQVERLEPFNDPNEEQAIGEAF